MNSKFRFREEIEHNPSSFVNVDEFYRCQVQDCQKNFMTHDAFRVHFESDHPFLPDIPDLEDDETISESSVEIIEEFENEKAQQIECHDMNSSTEKILEINEDHEEPVQKSAKFDFDALSNHASMVTVDTKVTVKIQSMRNIDHDLELYGKTEEKYNCPCGTAFKKISLLILHHGNCKRKIDGKVQR